MKSERKELSLISLTIGLCIGVLVGGIFMRNFDKRKERVNYFARRGIETMEQISDITDINNNEVGKLNDKLNTRLNYNILIISKFTKDDKLGERSRSMLNDICQFRSKYPYKFGNPVMKSEVESALTLGKKSSHGSQNRMP